MTFNSRSQRGVATLAVTLLVLLLGSLAVLSSSRVVFFGQKVATSTYHQGQALAAAQAGLDQMLVWLTHTGEGTPNRNTFFDMATARLRPEALPARGELAGSRASFQVSVLQPDAAGDPGLLRVTSTGCADGCELPGSPTVTLTQYVKFRNVVVATPDDALIARGQVNFSGNMSAHNTSGVGVAVRSGEAVTTKGASKIEGPVIAHDTRLRDSARSDFFAYFFGDVHEVVRAQLPQLAASFPPSGTQGGAYWIEGNTAVHGGTFGSPERPIVLIVNGNLRVNGNTTIYGLLYVVGDADGWDNSGGGNARIFGAAVSEQSFRGQGTPEFRRDDAVLARLAAWGAAARVPGGWSDF